MPLKDCAQFNREGGDGGHWTLKPEYKPPDDALDEADTPDMVYLYIYIFVYIYICIYNL